MSDDRKAEVAAVKLSDHHTVFVEVYYPYFKGIAWPGYTLKVACCSFIACKDADGADAGRIIISENNSWTPTKYRHLEEAHRYSKHKLAKWVKQLQEDKSYMDLVDAFRAYAAGYAAEQAKKGE
jgi:hypothetical protein